MFRFYLHAELGSQRFLVEDCSAGGFLSTPITISDSIQTDKPSESNSIATEFLSNVNANNSKEHNAKLRTEGISDQSTGLELNTVTPTRVVQRGQQGWHTPRLGNMFGLMNMLGLAAGMCPVTEGTSDDKSQGSQNIASVLGTTAIGATATSPNSQCGNKIMENKSETSKSSGVRGGDNSTPPRSGTMIGSLMNNSVISKHK